MTKIAYILLCHQDLDAVIEQALYLTRPDDYIAIHFDKGGSPLAYHQIRIALTQTLNVVLCQKRIKFAWGAWSLVQATLNQLQSALTAFPDATHFYLISGNCVSIKPIGFTHDFLSIQDVDYIDSCDYFESDWIKQGRREDRLIYRYYFNQRNRTRRFEMALALQKRFGLFRAIPSELEMQIGSQWWCLRRRSIEKILKFLRKRRDIKRFFKTTWIPDETLCQTLVRNLISCLKLYRKIRLF